MKLFNKTALALAMSTMTVAPAIAADLAFNSDQTTVLADVIFGDGNPGVGSDETLITAPATRFNLQVATGANNGDLIAQNGVATIKYTLGGGAVFGEDLSTTVLAAPFIAVNGAANINATVVQGGAIGDNTITFNLTEQNVGADAITSVDFGGFAVKNLQTALNPGSSDKTVKLGVEYVEPVVLADDADDIATTATDTPLTILGSMSPFTLTATPANFTATTRINVGNTEKTFTDADGNNTTFENGTVDFDPTNDVSVISLGTLVLGLNTAAPTFAGVAGNVRKENGDDFDFQGGDTHSLAFAVGSGSMQVGSSVYLSSTANCAANAFATTIGSSNTIAADETTGFNLVVSGTTTQLTSTYNVCYSVKTGTAADTIPEVGQISATWNVDFFNARYDNIAVSAGNFGDLKRNGCIASFFNIPASTNTDRAYVRLTNTSAVNEGYIRGTLYAEDGSVIGTEDLTIAPDDLAVSATQIFSTEAATRPSATTGMDVISIEEAFGIAPADITGRARLVLKGAFDTCEGLGLLRTGDGSLFNMTATTQGNEAAAPNDGNNGQ